MIIQLNFLLLSLIYFRLSHVLFRLGCLGKFGVLKVRNFKAVNIFIE